MRRNIEWYLESLNHPARGVRVYVDGDRVTKSSIQPGGHVKLDIIQQHPEVRYRGYTTLSENGRFATLEFNLADVKRSAGPFGIHVISRRGNALCFEFFQQADVYPS